MSLLTNQTQVNETTSFFGTGSGSLPSTIATQTVIAQNVSTATLSSDSISTIYMSGLDGYISTLRTDQITLDGATLNATGSELLLNGIPIATTSNLSSIGDWAYEPAISTVQMAGYDIIGANAVRATIGYMPTVQARDLLASTLRVTDAYSRNMYASTFQGTTISSVTGLIDVMNTRSVAASTINAGAGYFSSLLTNDITTNTLYAISTIQSIQYISTTDVVADEIDARLGRYQTLTSGAVSTNNVSTATINGVAWSNIINPASNVSQWATFAAVQNVDMGGYEMSNIDKLTMNGGVGNGVVVGAALTPVTDFTINSIDVSLRHTNPVTALGLTSLGQVAMTAPGDIDITSLDNLNLTGSDVNISQTSATSIFNLTTLGAGVQAYGLGLDITTGALLALNSGGSVQIGSANILGAVTSIEKVQFNDNVISKYAASNLVIQDVDSISGPGMALATVNTINGVPVSSYLNTSSFQAINTSTISASTMRLAEALTASTLTMYAMANGALGVIDRNAQPHQVAYQTLTAPMNAAGYGITDANLFNTDVLETNVIALKNLSQSTIIFLDSGASFEANRSVTVGSLGYTDTGAFVAGLDMNGFAQGVLVQNKNSGGNASANIVVVNDDAGADYTAVGINSATFTPLNNALFEIPSASYQSSTDNLVIGPQSDHSSQASVFLTYADGTKAMELNSKGALGWDATYNGVLNHASFGATGYALVSQGAAAPPVWSAVAGPTGAAGPAGATGPAGEVGATGAAGPAGGPGPTGAVGPQGPQGNAGETGAQGIAGATGPQGDIGPMGPAGATGAAGAVGATGAVGPAGATGAAGAVGATGAAGEVGATGAVGPAGAVGATGAAGEMGATGAQGIAGPTGAQGPAGADGATGAQGIAGSTGAQGIAGPTGAQGAAGQSSSFYEYKAHTNTQTPPPAGGDVLWNTVTQASATIIYISHLTSNNVDVDLFLGILNTGDALILQAQNDSSLYQRWVVSAPVTVVSNSYVQVPVTLDTSTHSFGNAENMLVVLQSLGQTGPQGPQGIQGPAGIAGPTGAAGANGAAGATGPAGADGATGPAGAAGATGAAGADGATGPAGAVGATGAAGADGVTGPAGADGATGAVGPAGATGAAGEAGATGPMGAEGPTGLQGPVGPQGSEGPTGPQGLAGATGSEGAVGPTGANGEQGIAGPTGAQGPAGSGGLSVTGTNWGDYLYWNNGTATWAVGSTSVLMGANSGLTGQSPTGAVAIGNGAGAYTQGALAIAIGGNAGATGQSLNGIAVGQNAGATGQGAYSIAIGTDAALYNQRNQAVAIGAAAGSQTQGTNAIAIGSFAGTTNQGQQAIAIGVNAGNQTQAVNALAIGSLAGQFFQAGAAVAVGNRAGATSQGGNAVAVGSFAGATFQGTSAVAIGLNSGLRTQGGSAVAIGPFAGSVVQGQSAVAVGTTAGSNTQGANAVAIGNGAASNSQASFAIALGQGAGQNTQGYQAIAIGPSAGQANQLSYAVALGANAALASQGTAAVAIGFLAGQTAQGQDAIAIGTFTAASDQKGGAVAIGASASGINQGTNAVAIGRSAVGTAQGENAIAIGSYAANNIFTPAAQAANTVVINAGGLGAAISATQANATYINPIRNDNTVTQYLAYNTTTKEVVYNSVGGPTGPAGPAGPTGAAGTSGAAGATGAPGAAGPTGAAGAEGPTGPAGGAGLTFVETSVNYTLPATVTTNGAQYVVVNQGTAYENRIAPCSTQFATVYATAYDSINGYVWEAGASFLRAVDTSGNAISGVPVWNTGGGTGIIHALYFDELGGRLIIGGSFTSLIGPGPVITSGNNVVVLDLNTFTMSTLVASPSSDIGVNGPVYSIVGGFDITDFYLGGAFTASGSTGAVSLLRVAGWVGSTSTWNDMVKVDDNTVKALARYTDNLDENYLVVGGDFTSIDVGTACKAIFQYNLTTPAGPLPIGSGFNTFLSAGADVRAIADAPNPNLVYVGGSFTDGGLITNAFSFSWGDASTPTEFTVAAVVQALAVVGTDPYFGFATGLQVGPTVVPSFTSSVVSFSLAFPYLMIGSSNSPYLYAMRVNEVITVSGLVGPGGASPATASLFEKGSSISVIGSLALNVWWVQSTNMVLF